MINSSRLKRQFLSAAATVALTGAGATSLAQPGSVTAAQAEMAALADALQRVFIDTTFFTTLENLDDVSVPVSGQPFNFINHNGGALVLRPSKGDWEPARLDLVNRPVGLEWQGPYMAYQSSRITGEAHPYDEGSPLDPWGNPYYLFSPLGLLAPRTESVTLDLYGDQFNDYMIVSLGPDGVMSGDDLLRVVPGGPVQVAVISSVRVEPSGARRSGAQVTIRGYNFGGQTGAAAVSVDGSDASASITGWSGSEILLNLPELPTEGAEFVVTLSGGSSINFVGFLIEGAANLSDWALFG